MGKLDEVSESIGALKSDVHTLFKQMEAQGRTLAAIQSDINSLKQTRVAARWIGRFGLLLLSIAGGATGEKIASLLHRYF
jgi:hypothetical protein